MAKKIAPTIIKEIMNVTKKDRVDSWSTMSMGKMSGLSSSSLLSSGKTLNSGRMNTKPVNVLAIIEYVRPLGMVFSGLFTSSLMATMAPYPLNVIEENWMPPMMKAIASGQPDRYASK